MEMIPVSMATVCSSCCFCNGILYILEAFIHHVEANLFVCNNAGSLQGRKRPLEASRVLEEYAKVRKLMAFDVDVSLIH